jgi:hypothetical protein
VIGWGGDLVIEERRADPRFEAGLHLRYRGRNLVGMERQSDGFVTNISKGGLLVGLASDRRREGARLMLSLPSPEGGWFEIPGVVVRVQELGFAVRFDDLDSAQQLKLSALLESIAKEAM